MHWKSLSTLVIALLICCGACKNTGKNAESKVKEKGISATSKTIVSIDTFTLSAPLEDILPSCAESNEYQKNEWPGKNNCSWALDKHLIRQFPEYVKRTAQGLEFQTDAGSWQSLSTTSFDGALLVNAYLSDFHLFILKHHNNQNCPEYLIYDPKSGHQTAYTGQFYLSPSKRHFAVLGQKNCQSKNMVGRFSRSKGVILRDYSEIASVGGLKWEDHALVFAVEEEGITAIQSIELP